MVIPRKIPPIAKVEIDKEKSIEEMQDDLPLTFGKYAGETPNNILEKDPSYLIWVYENIVIKYFSKTLYEVAAMSIYDDEYEYDLGDFYNDINNSKH